jgi:hypothetical protein
VRHADRVSLNHSIARRTNWAWVGICVALVFPLAAVLHHLVFVRSKCMLVLYGRDYDVATVQRWLTHDPSLWVAIVVALAIYALGRSNSSVRMYAAPVLPAFLPLTVWVWDVPFLHRPICHNFHDGKTSLPVLGPLRTRHIYVLGCIVYATLIGWTLLKRRRADRRLSQSGALAGSAE